MLFRLPPYIAFQKSNTSRVYKMGSKFINKQSSSLEDVLKVLSEVSKILDTPYFSLS